MAGDTSPERQAYSSVAENGYKGRFAANIINIRLMKDNPYIADLSEAERIELNANLLSPYQGEQFYDDDRNIYVADIIKDPISGEIRYTYTSQTKSVMDKLKYYESRGVLNQLMSAYNNGQVYKFYYDLGRKTLFPNSTLVFPTNYSFYTISKPGLNVNNQKVYVAGSLVDGQLMDVNIGMQVINDAINGTTYTRMGAAKIFENSSIDDGQYDIIKNGEFYVVDFFDEHGELIDTKQFQAVEAKVTNTKLPSSSVVKLKITVFRNGVLATTDSNIYGIYAGEDLSKTTSFAIIAVYADGTEKAITNKLDTAVLTREGWDEDTSGKAVGDTIPVKFTYWSDVDETGTPIGSSISETITFQILENTYTKLYRVLPVMWSDNITDLNVVNGSSVAVYKLKIYTMDQNGVVSNMTRAFYDTKMVVKSSGDTKTLEEFTACPVTYDPYQQCCIFTFAPNNIAQNTEFDFRIRSGAEEKNLRFIAKFGSVDESGMYIMPTTNYDKFGYEREGLLSQLEFTYSYAPLQTNQSNLVSLSYRDGTATREVKLSMISNDIYIADQYSRKINSITEKPNLVQFYAVKDPTFTAITPVIQIPVTAHEIIGNAYDDPAVREILSNNKSGNFFFAKFIKSTANGIIVTGIEVFKTVNVVVN